jgi:hypothetical protein
MPQQATGYQHSQKSPHAPNAHPGRQTPVTHLDGHMSPPILVDVTCVSRNELAHNACLPADVPMPIAAPFSSDSSLPREDAGIANT